MPQLPVFIDKTQAPRSIHNARIRRKSSLVRTRATWCMYGFVFGFSLAVLIHVR